MASLAPFPGTPGWLPTWESKVERRERSLFEMIRSSFRISAEKLSINSAAAMAATPKSAPAVRDGEFSVAKKDRTNKG